MLEPRESRRHRVNVVVDRNNFYRECLPPLMSRTLMLSSWTRRRICAKDRILFFFLSFYFLLLLKNSTSERIIRKAYRDFGVVERSRENIFRIGYFQIARNFGTVQSSIFLGLALSKSGRFFVVCSRNVYRLPLIIDVGSSVNVPVTAANRANTVKY